MKEYTSTAQNILLSTFKLNNKNVRHMLIGRMPMSKKVKSYLDFIDSCLNQIVNVIKSNTFEEFIKIKNNQSAINFELELENRSIKKSMIEMLTKYGAFELMKEEDFNSLKNQVIQANRIREIECETFKREAS